MEKTLGKEYANARERRQFLADNCDEVVEKGYMKPFGHQKLQEFKEKLADVSVKIGDVNERKEAAAAQFKTELKPLAAEYSEYVRNIKQKAEYVTEECYKMVDQDDKMVGFYNADGDLIESRPANLDELQGTIFQLGRATTSASRDSKTGTDN